MKKILLLMFVLAGATALSQAQNVTYLTDVMKPVNQHGFTDARNQYGTITLGGVEYTNGFTLRTTYGPTVLGYAEYSLKGKYSKLMFILGTSPYQTPGKKKGIFVIKTDGVKVMDRIITNYDVPERFTIDVEGVDKLRFEIVAGDVFIGIVEPSLWTKGQTPRETGQVTLALDKPAKLVQDIRPYKKDSYHKCVSVAANRFNEDLSEIRINSRSYDSGLELMANRQIIGNAAAATYFNLGGKFSRLVFIAGPKDSDSGTLGTAWLIVKGDDRILLEQEIKEGNLAREISLDITGCKWISFESEQASGSSSIGIADIMVYPEGYNAETVDKVSMAEPSDNLKNLPDVCKLVSNIPPYAIGGGMSREDAVFDGKSEHITFSMGGIKFNEGIVLRSSTNVLNDNTGAHALFSLGGEFDYVSFTAGWLSKCGVLKNDTLRVYTDTDLALEVPLIATAPNRHYVVPLNKCRRLCFEKRGMSSLSHPVFGIADIVVYRGEPVPNDLFVHPVPELPDNIDLIDLGAPYIHYVSPMKDHMDQIFYDGSTQRRYFQMPDGQRINKGFLLQTSVHFDLEAGPGGSPDAGVVSGMLGASVMVGAVGGATISAVSPFGAMIALASGGTAYESSCAAFNTWGAYDNVTFTVASKSPHTTDPISLKDKPTDKLLIGADGNVVAELEVRDGIDPTTFTVPINRCEQLMFWLQCGNWGSGQFIIYDISLSKGEAVYIQAPAAADVDSQASMTVSPDPYILPVSFGEREKIEWKQPKSAGSSDINQFFNDCNRARNDFESFFQSIQQDYRSVAKRVSSTDGTFYRAITIENYKGERYSISGLIERNEAIIKIVNDAQLKFTSLGISKVNANLALPGIGFRAIEFGKYIKEASQMLDKYKDQLKQVKEEKEKENELLKQLIMEGVTVDGKASDDGMVFTR